MASQNLHVSGKRSSASKGARRGREPELKAATKLVLEMMALRGPSGQDRAVAEFIRAKLLAAGARQADIRHDRAHRDSPLEGEIGNLVFKLPGTMRAPRRLLMAHLDTVPLCVGAKPALTGGAV